MKNTNTGRAKSGIVHSFGIPLVLAVGVLTGCEYCPPLLLAIAAYPLAKYLLNPLKPVDKKLSGGIYNH